MKINLFDTLLVQKDEDLRKKSLFPFNTSDSPDSPRFTRFIRKKYSEFNESSIGDNTYEDPSKPKGIIFTVPNPTTNEQLSFNQILQRYKDHSMFTKIKSKKSKERFIELWSKVLSLLFREKEKEIIFKKDSLILLVWNLIVMFCFLFNVFQIPIAIFFTSAVYDDQFNTTAGLFLNWFAITILLLNTLIVRPNTQFQKMGYLISSRQQIMNEYIGISLALDLLGVLILIIYASSYTSVLIFLKIFFYLEAKTIFALDQLIQNRLQLHLYSYALYRLVKLLIFMLFILTWLSSIFFYIDYYLYINQTYDYTQNWLTYSVCTYSIQNNNPLTINGTDLIATFPGQWYLWLNYGIYWSLQTISTVGYGDITPRNPPSVIFTNISILILMFFFVFFINTIIQIIDQTTSPENKQKQAKIKMFQLYDKASRRKAKEISLKYGYDTETRQIHQKFVESTANKIRSYLQDMDMSSLLDQQDNVQQLVNNNLTPELRQQLFINYRQLFFKKVMIFGEVAKVTSNFMQVYQQLIYKIKEVPYGSFQVIYTHHQDQSNCLYYLLKGNLLLKYPYCKYAKLITYEPKSQSIMQKNAHKQNDFYNFGVREFFTRQPRDHSAITESYCKIQTLQYQDFINTIKTFADFYTKYCELRDLLLIEKVNALTGEECFECHSKNHHLMTCNRCLFNVRFSICRDINFSQKKRDNERGYSIDCQRQPFFMRDCIRSQKLPSNHPLRCNKIYRQQICNYWDYFPTKNISFDNFQ